MQPTFMFTICVLGIVGNVFVLLVFGLHKKACTVAEIYLGNLAAADLLLVLCLPFWAINSIDGFKWRFGSLMCKLVNTGIRMNMFCSIYLLVLVSADRCIALAHALSRGRMRRPRCAKLNCIAVWVFGLILSIPMLHFRDTQFIPELNITACILNYPNPNIGLVCDILLILLGFIIHFWWSPTARWRSSELWASRSSTASMQKTLKESHHPGAGGADGVSLVLGAVPPRDLQGYPDALWRLQRMRLYNHRGRLQSIFTYLALSNSVLNPILYVIVGKNFRKKVKELMKQLTEKKNDLTSSSTRSQLSSTLKTFTTF